MSKILRVTWRSGGAGTVGIVLVKSSDGKVLAYIGTARSDSEAADAEWIAAYGARLSYKEASAFFDVKLEEYNEEMV